MRTRGELVGNEFVAIKDEKLNAEHAHVVEGMRYFFCVFLRSRGKLSRNARGHDGVGQNA